MLNSMTGFARVEDTCEQGSLSWEIRSVNHRYLEVNFRLPEEVRRLEPQLRTGKRGPGGGCAHAARYVRLAIQSACPG